MELLEKVKDLKKFMLVYISLNLLFFVVVIVSLFVSIWIIIILKWVL